MSEHIAAEKQLFYDPFAEEGEEFFDPQTAHQAMWQRYAAGEVKHDYTADKFVADTEALMMDVQFTGQFEEMQLIAERMHVLCGENHGLRESMESREFFNRSIGQDQHEGHSHTYNKEKKEKEKPGSRGKKKKGFSAWFSFSRARD